MSYLQQIYGSSLALHNDLYQLTMAYAYWKSGLRHTQAAFHLHFRQLPFSGGFAIACGLDAAIEYIQNFHFSEDDIRYLGTIEGNDGKVLFEEPFLEYLATMQFNCDVDAMPEGTPVFPYQPLVRVKGPVIPCQLLETPLLNIINFQTLIATKAARVCLAARGEPVLEFGTRRAQGIDGALSMSRAAFIGGCSATSNTLAGKIFGIPVKGTHAHSWVMVFDDELESFEQYAQALPNNCVFLVDTYDTIEGVRHAAKVGIALQKSGHQMAGIRLDSGDLARLSIEARRILDEAGLPEARIFASNDLDEYIIESLKTQNAAITVWGVGTRLSTAYDQPALGGVYKLSAVRHDDGAWSPRIKLSEQTAKISNPGIQQVRRYYRNNNNQRQCAGDMLYDIHTAPAAAPRVVDPLDAAKRWRINQTEYEDLLVPIFAQGKKVYDSPALADIRQTTSRKLQELERGIKRFVNPQWYPAGVEQSLHECKMQLIAQAHADADTEAGI